MIKALTVFLFLIIISAAILLFARDTANKIEKLQKLTTPELRKRVYDAGLDRWLAHFLLFCRRQKEKAQKPE